jgi:RHS repeat-associated protein
VLLATDRLGSVRATSAGGGSAYFPYGQEQQPTADGREKFGTYFRDGVGQDYAEQRYYGNSTGRFWSPDPLGTGAVDPTDPNSWNMYAYAGGDPINFNDPDGTAACGDLQILGTGSSLRSAVTGGGDTALLADLVWAESDHTQSRQASLAYYNEQDAIAWTVLNRQKILGGYLSVRGVSNPSTLGWGPNGASISQIIGWANQFSTITGGPSNPQLRSDLQSTLNSALNGSPTAGDVLDFDFGNLGIVSMTHECFDVWQSYVTASFALSGASSDPFASQGYTTSFHHGTLTTSLEGSFGNFGDANNFFGIAKGSITVNPTPVLPRPRPIRPPGPRPPGRGRRGPL